MILIWWGLLFTCLGLAMAGVSFWIEEYCESHRTGRMMVWAFFTVSWLLAGVQVIVRMVT